MSNSVVPDWDKMNKRVRARLKIALQSQTPLPDNVKSVIPSQLRTCKKCGHRTISKVRCGKCGAGLKAVIQIVTCPRCFEEREIQRMSAANLSKPFWCDNCRKTVKPYKWEDMNSVIPRGWICRCWNLNDGMICTYGCPIHDSKPITTININSDTDLIDFFNFAAHRFFGERVSQEMLKSALADYRRDNV